MTFKTIDKQSINYNIPIIYKSNDLRQGKEFLKVQALRANQNTPLEDHVSDNVSSYNSIIAVGCNLLLTSVIMYSLYKY
jgi:hypothetical protein